MGAAPLLLSRADGVTITHYGALPALGHALSFRALVAAVVPTHMTKPGTYPLSPRVRLDAENGRQDALLD